MGIGDDRCASRVRVREGNGRQLGLLVEDRAGVDCGWRSARVVQDDENGLGQRAAHDSRGEAASRITGERDALDFDATTEPVCDLLTGGPYAVSGPILVPDRCPHTAPPPRPR